MKAISHSIMLIIAVVLALLIAVVLLPMIRGSSTSIIKVVTSSAEFNEICEILQQNGCDFSQEYKDTGKTIGEKLAELGYSEEDARKRCCKE